MAMELCDHAFCTSSAVREFRLKGGTYSKKSCSTVTHQSWAKRVLQSEFPGRAIEVHNVIR